MEEDKKKDKGGSVQPEAPGFMSGLPRGAGNVQTSQQPIESPVANVFAPHAGVQGRFERGGAAPDNPTMQSRKDSPAEDTPLMRGQGYGRSSYPDSIPTRDTQDRRSPIVDVMDPIGRRTVESSPSLRSSGTRTGFTPDEMPSEAGEAGEEKGVDEIRFNNYHKHKGNKASDEVPEHTKSDTPTPVREVIEPINGRTIESSPSSRNDGLRPEFNPDESMPTNRNDKGDNGVDEIDTGYRSPLLSNIEGKEDSSTKYPFEGKRVTVGWDADGEPVYGDDSTKSPYASQGAQKVPEFKKDETKKDGGFFNWLGGLIKKRNGKRPGESDDEYDERMTRNKEKLLVLGDALRHMGNLYLTSKGGLSQKFNSPTDKLEADLKYRKAERAAKAAKEAEAGYKNAMLNLKINEQNANNAYRQQMLGYKDAAERRATQKMLDDKDHWEKQFGYKKDKDTADMEYKKGRDEVKDKQWSADHALRASSVAASWYRARNSKGGKGSTSTSMANLSTPKGHMNRKKDLNSIEKRQLKDYLYKNGYITKEAARQYNNALSEQERGAILNHWIGWAANEKGARGDRFRQALHDHYGYEETITVGSKNTPVVGSGKSKSTVPKGSKRSATPKGRRGQIVV